ncbi:MAG: chemotaxis protein CheX [bacterium]|nr:chemotaxis protein CheX [bacterium]
MSDISREMEAALVDSVSRTMEDMAFEQIEQLSEADAKAILEAPQMGNFDGENSYAGLGEGLMCLPQSNEQIWAALNLIDPIQGEIIIEVPQGYAAMMTESLFGPADDPYAEDLLRDALAEVLNTLAGLFVKALIPSSREYSLGFPATGTGSSPNLQPGAKTWYFDLSGQIMTVTMSIGEFGEFNLGAVTQREVIS